MKSRSKLLLSSAALVGALAVATTSTFAWFSTSNAPSVDEFELGLQAQGGVQIAIYAANGIDFVGEYASKINAEQVATSFGGSPVLTAVTSTDGMAFKIGENAAVKNKDFATVKLSLKSPTAMKISLNVGSTVASTGEVEWLSNIAGEINEYGTTHAAIVANTTKLKLKAVDAARVSFVVGSTAKAVWEPALAGSSSGFNTNGLGGFAYKSYEADGGAAITTETTLVASTITGAVVTKTELLTLVAGVAQDITVNIWLEGWDGDCCNPILGQKLQTALQFIGEAVV